MKRQTVPLHIDRKLCHLTLDDVLAWVCQQCGEQYFEEDQVQSIQDLLRVLEQKSEALQSAG